jgi:hypothetical protein
MLDLHGLSHYEAEIEGENYLSTCDLPTRIVTGNSVKMQQIVKRIVIKLKLGYYINHINMGQMIIISKPL